jgi:uncharacterized membrane protein
MRKLWGRLRVFFAKPEYFYAALSLVFGIILAVLVPFGGNSDETPHYYRVQQIAHGGAWASEEDINEGVWLDRGEADVINRVDPTVWREGGRLPFNTFVKYQQTGEKIRVKGFISAAVYSPVAYVPQVAAVWVARVVDLPLNLEVLLMRVLGVVAQTAIIFLAIRLLPRGKWFLAIFALLPTMVVQSAAISADAMTNSVVILFICMALAVAVAGAKNRRLLLALVGCSVFLALVKAPYFLLIALMPLLLIANKDLRRRNPLIVLVGGTILALSIALGWTVFVGNVPIWAPAGVDMGGQLAYSLSNPLTPITAFINSILSGYGGGLEFSRHMTLLGMFMWDTTPLSPYVMALSVVTVGFATMARDSREVTRKVWQQVWKWRWYGVLLVTGSVVAISGILYLKYTPVGLKDIQGVQGRYFLPLIPLAVLPFLCSSNKVKTVGIRLASVLCLIATVWTIVRAISFG